MGTKLRNPLDDIREYHAHIYFNSDTRASVLKLYEALKEFGQGRIHLNTIADQPRGPHVPCMFGVDIPKDMFEAVFGFLLLNHGPHSVLFHPVTGNELLDHTHHAAWLGQVQPLNLSVLV